VAGRGIVKIMTDVPGPKSRQLYSEAEQNVPKGVGHQTPIAVSSARGATITDVDGNTYLDFAGGIGALNVGHCPDQVVKATKEPAPKETALVREKCYQNGLIILGAGIHHNVIRILVPLVITNEELEEGLSILEESFKSI